MTAWNNEWTSNPEAFHGALVSQRREAYEALKQGDEEPLQRLLDRLCGISALVSREPWLSTLESHLAGALIVLAEFWFDRVQWQYGYEALTRAWEILDEKARRRALCGLPARPESENRFRLLNQLAAAKWLGPAEYKLDIAHPLEMWDYYDMVENTLRRNLADHPRGPYGNANLLHGLAWCGVNLLCLGLRYQQPSMARWLAVYARRHGELLRDKSQPFYWQYRLGDEVADGRLNKTVLTAMYNARNEALEKASPGLSMVSTNAATKREISYLLEHRAHALEVMSASA